MADVVMGAMGSLIPKLLQLLKDEYKLQSDAKERVKYLTAELEAAQAALRKVGLVPWDELDEQVKLWARDVRESSYDMEDVLDTFLVHHGSDKKETSSSLAKRLGDKMATFLTKTKARRKISVGVKDIMSHLDDVAARCRRYKVDDIVARPAAAAVVDPRLAAMYNKVKNLVGIQNSSADLISKLQLHDPQRQDMRIVSVVGVGGLGKTTLAKAVHDKVEGHFDRRAFVPVGRNPDLTKVIQGILLQLDREYMKLNIGQFPHISDFINELQKFLQRNKRYFIVIDDIWEVESWETIRLAFDDDNSGGGRVLITTRKLDVASKADEVYKLPPLPYASSRELFYSRMSGDEGEHSVDNSQPDEVSDDILKKCCGIPLAIITMASLFVGKPRDRWSEIYKSVGFGDVNKKESALENNIMKILSFSYYDLPSHLRTCLLYLSAFPEDSFIHKESLVWKWVAEGFVEEVQGLSLFEVGEGYFNDLVNRSLIQEAVEETYLLRLVYVLHGCRVHDMVLDFIRSMSREENFFTILDNSNQVAHVQSDVRRLAHHNRVMGQTHQQANHCDGMPKLRAFSAHVCVIETWAPLSSFTLLRVLAIENCRPTDGSCIKIEQLGHLLHLRYLSLRNTSIDSFPKEIGALKWLQTLDLRDSFSYTEELPSSISFPTQLMCLRMAFPDSNKVVCLERLTSLVELEIEAFYTGSWRVKDLGCLRELRVLMVHLKYDEETERELVESLRHLHKLQHLSIVNTHYNYYRGATWEAEGFVLPRHLRLLATYRVIFSKLPSSINPWSLANLSHLALHLEKVDEQGMKMLGGLPELCHLELSLSSSATISNINVTDSDDGDVYFPKLRYWRLPFSMVVLSLGNDKKGVSFHLWDGYDDIDIPSAVADDDGDESQRPIASDSGDVVELDRRPMKLQHGLAALIYCYFLAFFQHVLAFVRKWSLVRQVVGQRLLVSTASSAASVDENNNGSISTATKDDAATPRFMPSLQVLHFRAHERAVRDHRYCDNLGLEYLPSLREISVEILIPRDRCDAEVERVEAALRCAADVHHPNRPTLHIDKLDLRSKRRTMQERKMPKGET